MRKCGGNAISARRKVDGRRVDGSLFQSFLMMCGLQKSERLRLVYQAKLFSFHIKVV